jgi:hypothetical protein
MIDEFRQIMTINSGLKKLEKHSFDLQSLLPQERRGVEGKSYVLRRGDHETCVNTFAGLDRCRSQEGAKKITRNRFSGL